MSIYDPISLGPLKLLVRGIHADNVQLELVAIKDDEEGPWIEDGQINVPVRLWEEMQDSQKLPMDHPASTARRVPPPVSVEVDGKVIPLGQFSAAPPPDDDDPDPGDEDEEMGFDSGDVGFVPELDPDK